MTDGAPIPVDGGGGGWIEAGGGRDRLGSLKGDGPFFGGPVGEAPMGDEGITSGLTGVGANVVFLAGVFVFAAAKGLAHSGGG